MREPLKARPLRHGRGDRDHALVGLGEAHERLAERVGEGRAARRRPLVAVAELEGARAVKRLRVRLGRLVALALERLDVQDDRTARIDGLPDARPQGVHVVAVDYADVREAELLEEHARDQQGLHRLLDVLTAAVRLGADHGDARHAALQVLAQAGQRRVQADAVEVQLQRAHVRLDGHLVVVEHHHEGRAQVTGLVHGLEGGAAGERAVADDADHGLLVIAGQARGLDQAEPIADGRRGMAGPDDVVLRLRTVREAGQAAVLPDRAEGRRGGR